MSELEQHPQWQAASQIYSRLNQKGYQALVAGGAVRDLLMGRVANDIDIATDATPEQVESLFEKTVMVGREFGVARVIVDGHDVEVATFRKDGPYLDGRKPEYVEFASAKEDASRRDFTVNAMFYDPLKKQVIDYVGGQSDLMKKIIRTVGDPDKRFEEDKLRILRAIRFHGQLDFAIEAKTADAIRKHSIQIKQVSMERNRDEWEKILKAKSSVKAIRKTHELGLWRPLFSDWVFQPEEYEKHFSLPEMDTEKAWILWFLIHCPVSEEKLATTALHWKLPKKLIKKMVYCQQSLPQLRGLDKIEPVDVAIFLNKPNGRLAVEVFKQLHFGKVKESWYEKIGQGEKFFTNGRLPALLVSGDDLIQFGIAPGPRIAAELKRLYRLQIKEGIKSKEELLKHLTN